jgi:hypothetical protein
MKLTSAKKKAGPLGSAGSRRRAGISTLGWSPGSTNQELENHEGLDIALAVAMGPETLALQIWVSVRRRALSRESNMRCWELTLGI